MKTKLLSKTAQRLKELEDYHAIYMLALSDAVNNRVKWFSSGSFKIGISRATGAAGGIALVQGCNGSLVQAYYWDKFYSEESRTIDHCITGEDNQYNRELIQRRNLLETVQKYVRDQQAI